MSDDRLRDALLAAALIDVQERENERLRQEEEEEEESARRAAEEERARREAEKEEDAECRAAGNGEPGASADARPTHRRSGTDSVLELVKAGMVIVIGIYGVGRFLVRKVRGK